MNEFPTADDPIRQEPRPRCYLCGGSGAILYAGMRDRLFGVPGEWSLRKCPDSTCGLVWLDPCPIDEDIPKLYRTYYTHATGGRKAAKRVYKWLCDAILSVTLGYPSRGSWNRLAGRVMSKSALIREALEGDSLWLPAAKGTLLDVGCGNGDFLHRMRELGWEVAGLEPDANSAAVARGRGLSVTTGVLGDLSDSVDKYDAVTMSHVLEHLPDPIGALSACRRLLKPGGRLVAVTPNAESQGAHVFGADWLGFDAPRHLTLATRASLQAMASKAGFATFEVRASVRSAWTMWHFSDALTVNAALPGLRIPISLSRIPIGIVYHLKEHSANRYRPRGEELVLTAVNG